MGIKDWFDKRNQPDVDSRNDEEWSSLSATEHSMVAQITLIMATVDGDPQRLDKDQQRELSEIRKRGTPYIRGLLKGLVGS